jgi:hypothetical protein
MACWAESKIVHTHLFHFLRIHDNPRPVWTLALTLLGACSSPGGSDADSDGTASDTGDGSALECNVPQLFAERCGGDICHSSGESTAAGLDLTSPGLESRVSGVPGNNCAGVLAISASPETSLLYQKVAETPTCGAQMPINGEHLSEGELICLRNWISGLLPPGSGDEGGTNDPQECAECVCEPGEEESCYTGPEGSEDLGICGPGMHTCNPDGLAWGPCEGQTTPQGEDCFTPDVDEDCDGATPACSELWSLSFGDETKQAVRSVALDSAGNVFSVGDFEGTVSFGGEPLVASGIKADLFLAKHDRYGNPLWSKRFGDSSNQYASKVLVDDQDNILYLARIFGNADFGGGELHGEGAGDVVIAKFDNDGNHIWSRVFGDLDPDRAERMAIDSQGNVLLTGTFTGQVDYGSGLFTSAGMRDAFVLKLDGSTGAHEFALQIGGTGDDYGFGIDADANDNIVISGRYQDTIQLGIPFMSEGLSDLYLAKLTPNGDLIWAKSFGGPGNDGVHDLRVQPQTGNIVLIGYMAESMSFGGPPLVSAGERDIFLATLDPNGAHVWSARYGDAVDQFTSTFEINTWLTLALDDTGAIHIGGSLQGKVDFGGAPIASASEKPDIFFVKLDAGGNLLTNRRFGGIGTDMGLDIAIDNLGYVILGGRSYGSSIDFGVSGVVKNSGSGDGILVKLLP